jgi:hypothetical protein
MINPNGIVPIGPELDFSAPHDGTLPELNNRYGKTSHWKEMLMDLNSYSH